MNELVPVPWWVCVEAKRALHSVIEDKNSYYARVMVDDAANIRGALEHLESAIDNRKGGQPPPTLTDAEREAIAWAAREADQWEDDEPVPHQHAATLPSVAGEVDLVHRTRRISGSRREDES